MPNVQKLVPGAMRGIGKHVTSAKRGKTCDRCQARNIKGGSPYQARKKRVTFGSWSEHIDEIFHLELNKFRAQRVSTFRAQQIPYQTKRLDSPLYSQTIHCIHCKYLHFLYYTFDFRPETFALMLAFLLFGLPLIPTCW